MSSDFVAYTALKSTGDRPRVSFESIGSYKFALPPVAEQHRIVAKIDSLSVKSKRCGDQLDHIPRLAEKYKQAILAAAFRGELTKDWRASSSTAKAAPGDESRSRSKVALRGASKSTAARKIEPLTPTLVSMMWKLPDDWQWKQIGAIAFVTKLAGFEYTKFVEYFPDGDLNVISRECRSAWISGDRLFESANGRCRRFDPLSVTGRRTYSCVCRCGYRECSHRTGR